VYPQGSEYAVKHLWYTNNEAINFRGRIYKKFGQERIMGPNELVKVGKHQGVNVYSERVWRGLLYVPVRQGCEFQPYETTLTAQEYMNVGTNYIMRKSYWDAIEPLSKCIELAPTLADCYMFRGTTYGYARENELSKADYKKAFELSKTPLNVYFLRGMMYMETGNKEDAIADFRSMLKLDPNNVLAKSGLKHLGIVVQ
jgi:tetratricopeptide (TPR) repeat protein